MKFIHITDTHITPPGQQRQHQDSAATLRRCIADINAHHADAELCVITGDITHNGEVEAYQLMGEILTELTVPVYLLIGNHDLRDTAAQLLPQFKRDTAGFLQQVVATSVGDFILLDTVAEGIHAGAYCSERQAWLADQLAQRPDRPVWLFAHHAPFATGMKAMDTIGINASDATQLGKIVAQHRQIKHFFFGHYHRPISGQWQGIPISCHRSMMMQCALDFTTPDSVNGIFEQPQYAIVLANEHSTLVHYHDFASGLEVISMGTPDD